MSEYKIVPTIPAHIDELAVTMRKTDQDEVWAASHRKPKDALLLSLEVSRDTMTGLVDGRVMCIFGVAQPTLLSMSGIPWMLGTDELPQHARRFLRVSKDYIRHIKSQYRKLHNFVDARNIVAIRWLKWLDFKVEPAVPFGPDQKPFHPFYWTANV